MLTLLLSLPFSTCHALPVPLERHPASRRPLQLRPRPLTYRPRLVRVRPRPRFRLSPRPRSLNEYIALGTYGIVGLGAWAAMRGGSDAKKADDSKLDITSQTDDKEMIAFIENFINNEEHKAKSAGGH